jgi:micrococcal nuclease
VKRLALLLVIAAVGGCRPVPTSTPASDPVPVTARGEAATVVSITDGDTFRARLPGQPEGKSTPVRLIGVDTPETRKPNSPVECYGPEASAELAALIPVGSTVWLTYDKERTDRYDRTLAYVAVVVADGAEVDVNATMVSRGAAIAKRYPPNTANAEAYERAQAAAKADRLGLWGACAA